jgi:hypothetical protein
MSGICHDLKTLEDSQGCQEYLMIPWLPGLQLLSGIFGDSHDPMTCMILGIQYPMALMALMILMPFRNTHGFHDRRIVRNIP